MTQILTALGVLGGLGLVFGTVLGGASILFYVKPDDRAEKIISLLPGANCGGCGFAGCANFAAAVLEGTANPDGCTANSAENAVAIGEVMGVSVEPHRRMVANVLCKGTRGVADDKYEYAGVDDCAAAMRLGGGAKQCAYACLGQGSCLKVCRFDAISIENGIAVIDREKCTACGMCVDICPKNVISMVPYDARTIVECSSKDKGNIASKACRVGCIACRICVKVCPVDAIVIENNLASVDYEKCINCGECVRRCPRGIIYENIEAI